MRLRQLSVKVKVERRLLAKSCNTDGQFDWIRSGKRGAMLFFEPCTTKMFSSRSIS